MINRRYGHPRFENVLTPSSKQFMRVRLSEIPHSAGMRKCALPAVIGRLKQKRPCLKWSSPTISANITKNRNAAPTLLHSDIDFYFRVVIQLIYRAKSFLL